MSESSVDNIFFKIYILIYTSVIAIFGIRQINIYSNFESGASDKQKIRLIEQVLNNYLLSNEAYLDAKLNL